MRVLDLFCGLKGWSQAFKDRGHTVITFDIESKFNPTVCNDIRLFNAHDFEGYGQFDIVLASPPCNQFSIASVYKHWKDKKPTEAIDLVSHTLRLILGLYPKWWILENPTGMLRKVMGNPQAVITQCQYGKNSMKPTDLWGVFPKSFKPKRCKNGDDCHDSAPRGSKTGTQGLANSELRAKIPYGLSLAVCLACEKEYEI